MTLVTVVVGFTVLNMAIRTIELILIVRRHVRIMRLHIGCLLTQPFGVMALRTGFNRRILDVFGIRTVAGLTFETSGDVAVGTEIIGCMCRSESEEAKSDRNRSFLHDE